MVLYSLTPTCNLINPNFPYLPKLIFIEPKQLFCVCPQILRILAKRIRLSAEKDVIDGRKREIKKFYSHHCIAAERAFHDVLALF